MSKDKRYQTDDLSKLPDDLDSMPQPQTQTVVPTPPQPKQQQAAMPKPMPQADYVCLKDRMAALMAEMSALQEKIEVQEGVLNAIRALETTVSEGQAKINEVLVQAVQRLVDAEVRRAEAETHAIEAAQQATQARAQREQEAAQHPQPEEATQDDAPWWKLHWLGAWWTHRRQLKARKRRQREAQEDAEWEIAQRKRLKQLRELADGPASVEGVQASIDADKLEEEINRKKKSAAA